MSFYVEVGYHISDGRVKLIGGVVLSHACLDEAVPGFGERGDCLALEVFLSVDLLLRVLLINAEVFRELEVPTSSVPEYTFCETLEVKSVRVVEVSVL